MSADRYPADVRLSDIEPLLAARLAASAALRCDLKPARMGTAA